MVNFQKPGNNSEKPDIYYSQSVANNKADISFELCSLNILANPKVIS